MSFQMEFETIKQYGNPRYTQLRKEKPIWGLCPSNLTLIL